MSKFIDLCVSGMALIDDIDDYIDEWHDGDSEIELHEFLGMTEKEYKFYVVEPDILPYIINAHKTKKSFDHVAANVTNYQTALAARSSDLVKARSLMEYLKTQQLI